MTKKMSHLLQKLELVSKLQVRMCSTASKFKLLDSIQKAFEDDKIKPRKHPGINSHKINQFPEWLNQAIRQTVEDANQSQILKDREKLGNYLFSRRLPAEKEGMKEAYFQIQKELLGTKLENLTEQETERACKKIQNKIKKKMKQSVFNWKPIDYNGYRSSLYMVTRSAGEYSALNCIFNEIKKRDSQFNPQTIFDFGSGVGTVLWAASENWNNINEYVGIDISNDMHELAEQIVNHSPVKIKGVYYRQYLPVSNLKFDLVVSAYTLMDLPDAKCRLETLSKLWNKTSKYLVIVEQGTRAGFTLINEAREFIKYMEEKSKKKSNCFTFAPCPHDLSCPRFAENKTPCNFLTQYRSMSLLGPVKDLNELYSYVILKKGTRNEDDNWYRVVRPTIARSKHARCRLCTPSGKLQEVIFTASKYGKMTYNCAKATSWGDRLPIRSTTDPVENVNEGLEHEVSNETKEDEEEEIVDEIEPALSSEAPIFVKNHE